MVLCLVIYRFQSSVESRNLGCFSDCHYIEYHLHCYLDLFASISQLIALTVGHPWMRILMGEKAKISGWLTQINKHASLSYQVDYSSTMIYVRMFPSSSNIYITTQQCFPSNKWTQYPSKKRNMWIQFHNSTHNNKFTQVIAANQINLKDEMLAFSGSRSNFSSCKYYVLLASLANNILWPRQSNLAYIQSRK